MKRLVEIHAVHEDKLLHLLHDQSEHLSNAYRHADEICDLGWHDDDIRSSDDYGRLIFVDQEIHPAYLRLTEAVFRPLLQIIAHFSRVDRGKGVDNLDLHQIKQELQSERFQHILSPYDHLMRNGIAHGGVTYSTDMIEYEDKRGNRKKLDIYEIMRRFDNLLDVCNGMLLAFSVFMFTRDNSKYELPSYLLIEELRAATRTPYWDVVGCLPSSYANQSQLISHIKIHTSDWQKVQLSLFQTAVILEKMKSGYDRYFFSFRSNKTLPGFAAFDGQKLTELRKAKAPLEQYDNVLEKDVLFFSPKFPFPRMIAKLESIWLSYKVNRPLISADFRKKMGWLDVNVRIARIHRNGWGAVVDARVVIGRDIPTVDRDLVRRHCSRIVRKGVKVARDTLSHSSLDRYLPLGFCRISVYRRDYRVRRLSNLGLADDLVCTIQVQRIRRIKSPDIAGSTIETKGRYRIAWNRNWLKESDDTPDVSTASSQVKSGPPGRPVVGPSSVGSTSGLPHPSPRAPRRERERCRRPRRPGTARRHSGRRPGRCRRNEPGTSPPYCRASPWLPSWCRLLRADEGKRRRDGGAERGGRQRRRRQKGRSSGYTRVGLMQRVAFRYSARPRPDWKPQPRTIYFVVGQDAFETGPTSPVPYGEARRRGSPL